MSTALTPDAALAMCELWFEKHSPTAELINGLGRTEHPMLTMIKASLAAHAEAVNAAPDLLRALTDAGDIIQQANLLSTASHAEQVATLERLFAWMNGPRLDAITKAEGA